MSLINDMLNDLEARRGGEVGGADAVLDGLRGSAASAAVPRDPTLSRALVLLLVIASALGAWFARDVSDQGMSILSDIRSGVATFMAAPVVAQPLNKMPKALPMSGNAALPPETLNKPRDGHTVYYYQPLSLDEGEELRRFKLVDPEDVPEMINKVSEFDSYGQGEVATTITQTMAHSDAVATLVESHSKSDIDGDIDSMVPLFVSEPELISGPSRPDSASEIVVYQDEREPVQAAFEMKPIAVESTPADVLKRALRMLANGESLRGIDALVALLKSAPEFDAARIQLAEAHVRANRTGEAMRILRDGLNLSPNNAAYARLLAHLLVERTAITEALQVLKQGAPAVATDPDYHAFIGALEQRLGEHDSAIVSYRQVVAVSSDNGIWWMGLAISLSASGEHAAARDAFESSLGDRTLADHLRQYATREIARLDNVPS